jgi:lipopolysaccharide/colanic/teichoic acid biosynthesis glycosyltransferase
MELKPELANEFVLPSGSDGTAWSVTRDRRTILYVISLLLDQLALVGGYFCARLLRDDQWLSADGRPIIFIALPVFTMLVIAREVQSVEALQDRLTGVTRSLGALAGAAFVTISLGFLSDSDGISRLGVGVTFGLAAVLVVIGKFLLDFLRKIMLGDHVLATILLKDGLEATPEASAIAVDVGSIGLWPDPERPDMIDRLSRIIAPYDRVIVACEYNHRGAWAMFLRGHDVGGEILLDRDLLHGAVAVGEYDRFDTIILSRGPLSLMNRLQKRALDLVVASLALLLLSPLLLVTAIAIKIDTPGPVFFRQTRVGQGNRQFEIFKFRSMRIEAADQAGNRSASRGDDRVTKVGRIIRKTSIDELPQLLNVLKGDMSVVGPRPHALGSTAGDDLFWHASQQYWLRHALKPGITGLAQIRGFRGATDRKEDLEQRVRCDLEYLSSWSLINDMIILAKTVRVVIHKNAY